MRTFVFIMLISIVYISGQLMALTGANMLVENDFHFNAIAIALIIIGAFLAIILSNVIGYEYLSGAISKPKGICQMKLVVQCKRVLWYLQARI